LTLAALSCGFWYPGAGIAGSATTPIWCDPATDLCWQNPQRAGFSPDDVGLIATESKPYCESLVLGGYADWRVPTIDELRTLIAGNSPTQASGDCRVSVGSRTGDGFNPACHGNERFAGPAGGGCYWNPALTGRCDKVDVAAVKGKMLETWASDQAVNDPEHWTAYVSFDTAGVGFNHNCSHADVRCVRDKDGQTPACIADDTCVDVDDYDSNPQLTAVCDADVCAISDAVKVTLHVPEKLNAQPHQLMVFWYKEQDWRVPPMRPPDGGTDYNQVLMPDINMGKPITITVPACKYYREDILNGEFRLWAHLQMQKRSQPTPQPGDFIWSSPEPVVFPLNGDKHEANRTELDITLRRVE
jgi:hypothetical protein